VVTANVSASSEELPQKGLWKVAASLSLSAAGHPAELLMGGGLYSIHSLCEGMCLYSMRDAAPLFDQVPHGGRLASFLNKELRCVHSSIAVHLNQGQ